MWALSSGVVSPRGTVASGNACRMLFPRPRASVRVKCDCSSRRFCVSTTGVEKFVQVVFNAVKDKVREGILELIEKERKGEGVDRELLKSVVNVSFSSSASSYVSFRRRSLLRR